jgi:hypothetical protein
MVLDGACGEVLGAVTHAHRPAPGSPAAANLFMEVADCAPRPMRTHSGIRWDTSSAIVTPPRACMARAGSTSAQGPPGSRCRSSAYSCVTARCCRVSRCSSASDVGRRGCGRLKRRKALEVGLSFGAAIHVARERIIQRPGKKKAEDHRDVDPTNGPRIAWQRHRPRGHEL